MRDNGEGSGHAVVSQADPGAKLLLQRREALDTVRGACRTAVRRRRLRALHILSALHTRQALHIRHARREHGAHPARWLSDKAQHDLQ